MLPYRTAVLRALNKAFMNKDTSIFVVVKFTNQDNYVLITNTKETFMGTAEVLMQRYLVFILHFVRNQYLTLKARHGVANEPERGSSLDKLATLITTDDLFISAMTQKLHELTIDQVHIV